MRSMRTVRLARCASHSAAHSASAAVRAIFAAKARPADNPLIVHAASAAGLRRVVAADALEAPAVQALMARFWPGCARNGRLWKAGRMLSVGEMAGR